MPKIARELTDLEVRRIKRTGMHAVGGVPGLLLRVSNTGARHWILRATVGDRRRDIGLGSYPAVTLATARDRAREKKDLIYQDIDPVVERERQRQTLIAEQQKQITFAEVWSRFQKTQLQGLTPKTIQHWHGVMNNYALPSIGSIIVGDIETQHIKAVLDQVWLEKPMMGKKLRQRLEKVLDYAKGYGFRSGDNPASWKGNLDLLLPKVSQIHKPKHFEAIPADLVPEFLQRLREREGMAARALELQLFTGVRGKEVRESVWSEFDLKKGIWTIPKERRLKDQSATKTDHQVPLVPAMIKMLKALPKESEYVFPNATGGPFRDHALMYLMRKLNYGDYTAHGLRSTFKDYCREHTDYQDFLTEMALGHTVSSEVMRAYARSDLLKKRFEVMQTWADYLEGK